MAELRIDSKTHCSIYFPLNFVFISYPFSHQEYFQVNVAFQECFILDLLLICTVHI